MSSYQARTSDSALEADLFARPKSSQSYSIAIVRTLTELMHAISVRSAVFMSEQDCPYQEEFDGNDFVATHLVAYKEREPVACLRVRFFADFAKIERLAVLHRHRKSRVSFKLVSTAIELARKKGYRRIYGHAQDRLVHFWAHFGARPIVGRPKLTFSDFSYTEMLLETDPATNAISLASDPYVIIRPEGEWDEPGILDYSASRPVTSPLRYLDVA